MLRIALVSFLLSATASFAATHDVSIASFAFSPNSLTIQAGDTVRWTNMDGAPHTSTSDSGTWDSGTLSTNSTFSFTFASPGSFSYFCAIHPFMTATITVNAPAPAPSVSAVNPPNGPTTGASFVTVSGTGFAVSPGLRVVFGSADATPDLPSSSSSSLAVSIPAHAAGTVDVQVINPDGQSGTLAGGFTYSSCFSIVTPLFLNLGSGATSGAIQVTNPDACSWTASAPPGAFVTVTGGTSGFGSGSVTYTVASNPTSAARTTSLSVSGTPVVVTQSANGSTPIVLDAAAVSGSQVNLSWTAVSGATYSIQRSAGGGPLAAWMSTTALTLSDTTVNNGVGYLYRVAAAQSGITVSYSNVDLAVPFGYADASLIGVFVQALHFNQLRQALNAARAAAGWPPLSFTDALSAGVPVKRIHLIEARPALDDLRRAFGLASISYADPVITAGLTVIRAAQLQEIRDGLK